MRIDQLTPNQEVTLRLTRNDQLLPSVFLRIEGAGEDRRAWFRSADDGGNDFEWSAYRSRGGWAYGSGADRLVLVQDEKVATKGGQPGDPIRLRNTTAHYQLQTRGRYGDDGRWARRDRPGAVHETADYNAALDALEQLRDAEPAWEHRMVQVYRVTETTTSVVAV